VASEHRFYLVHLVGSQRFLDAVEWHAFAPFRVKDLHVEAKALGHVDPQVAELTEARSQDLVLRGECVR